MTNPLTNQITQLDQEALDTLKAQRRNCTCHPCERPAYGAPGFAHCAACCYGILIEEYDHNCPVEEHREMAERQHPMRLAISDG